MIVPTYSVAPRYPREARSTGVEGWIELQLELDSQGHVIRSDVLESEPPGFFDDAAKTAVARWRYCPPTEVGQPYPDPHTTKLKFEIE
jgi:protein TonB